MSKKSIAQQIFSELKEESETTLRRNQELCRKALWESFFSHRYTKCQRIESDQPYLEHISIECLSKSEISVIFETLGFKHVTFNPPNLQFTIPSCKEGEQLSVAQKMLMDYTTMLNKQLKYANEQAWAETQRVWDLIKTRKFEHNNNGDGTFTITIQLYNDRGGAIGDQKILNYLKNRAFPNATITGDTLKITFGESSDKKNAYP